MLGRGGTGGHSFACQAEAARLSDECEEQADEGKIAASDQNQSGTVEVGHGPRRSH